MKLFGPGVVRVERNGTFWMMNHKSKGWGSYGYPYQTLGELLSRWDVKVLGEGKDEHGIYFDVA